MPQADPSTYKRRLYEVKNPNIYEYPTEIVSFDSECDLTLGDLHGNFMKLLYFLVRNSIVSIDRKDYKTLADIYRKIPPPNPDSKEEPLTVSAEKKNLDPEILSKEDLENFRSIVQKLKLNPQTPKKLLRLIGDELSDRGKNDYYTLYLFKQMHQMGLPFEIIFSNHSAEFLYAYWHKKPSWNTSDPRYETEYKPAHHSQLALNQLIDAGFITQEEVDELVEYYYLPHLKALSYSISPDNSPDSKSTGNLTLYPHAPTSLETVQKIAHCCNIAYDDSNLLALCRTLDKINAVFAQKIPDFVDHIVRRESFPDAIVDLVWIRYERYVINFLRQHKKFYENYQKLYPKDPNREDPNYDGQFLSSMKFVSQLSNEELEKNIAELPEEGKHFFRHFKNEFKKFINGKLSHQVNTNPDAQKTRYNTRIVHGHCGLDNPIHKDMTNLDNNIVGREDLTGQEIELLHSQRPDAFNLSFFYSTQISEPFDNAKKSEHVFSELSSLFRQDLSNMIRQLETQLDIHQKDFPGLCPLKQELQQWPNCDDADLLYFYDLARTILDELNALMNVQAQTDHKQEISSQAQPIKALCIIQTLQLQRLLHLHPNSHLALIIKSLIERTKQQTQPLDQTLFTSLIQTIERYHRLENQYARDATIQAALEKCTQAIQLQAIQRHLAADIDLNALIKHLNQVVEIYTPMATVFSQLEIKTFMTQSRQAIIQDQCIAIIDGNQSFESLTDTPVWQIINQTHLSQSAVNELNTEGSQHTAALQVIKQATTLALQTEITINQHQQILGQTTTLLQDSNNPTHINNYQRLIQTLDPQPKLTSKMLGLLLLITVASLLTILFSPLVIALLGSVMLPMTTLAAAHYQRQKSLSTAMTLFANRSRDVELVTFLPAGQTESLLGHSG